MAPGSAAQGGEPATVLVLVDLTEGEPVGEQVLRRPGAVVVQVYAGDVVAPVPMPPQQLAGFAKEEAAKAL